MSDLDYPFQIDRRGRSAATTPEDHVRDLIEQVLLTAPGERVMRPTFGSGLLALVFEPNSATLAATTQMLVHGALQENLSHLIKVQGVDVVNDDGALRVDVRYTLLLDRAAHTASFVIPGSVP
jgi:phage baseplate assembly protein W